MENDTDGFETLLRPVRDAITKNWDNTIKSYLEKYLEYLCAKHDINFSQAALILQNSMRFYCKRVDLLYDDLRNFILIMSDGDAQQGGNNNTIKKGRKHIAKSYTNDDLQVLGLINSDVNNYKENTVKNGTSKERVILNPCAKIPIKAETECKISLVEGREFGYKDEFRLFWPNSALGVLADEFTYEDESTRMEESSRHINADSFVNEDVCYNDDCDMDLEPCAPSTDDLPEMSALSPTMPPPPPLEVDKKSPKRRKQENRKRKSVDWCPLSFNFVIPLRKLRVKQVFKLPPQLVSEIIEDRKKRKREPETDKSKADVVAMSHIFYQNDVTEYKCDAVKIKCKLAKERRAMLAKRNTKKEVIMNGDSNGEVSDDGSGDDNDCDHDDGDCSNDNEVEPNNSLPPQLNVSLDNSGPVKANGNTYMDTVLRVAGVYGTNKKKHSKRATELTKKVSEWHESIRPALEMSEARSVFNAHEYGTQILEEFTDGDKDSTVYFKTLVKKQPREEISRFLLASLMLANTYNIEIIQCRDGPRSNDKFQMKLLSKVRHHELLDKNIGATAAEASIS